MSKIAFEGSSLAANGGPLAVRVVLYASPNRWDDGLTVRTSPSNPPESWVFAQTSSPTGHFRGCFDSAVAGAVIKRVRLVSTDSQSPMRPITCSVNGRRLSIPQRGRGAPVAAGLWCFLDRPDGYLTLPLIGEFAALRSTNIGTVRCNLEDPADSPLLILAQVTALICGSQEGNSNADDLGLARAFRTVADQVANQQSAQQGANASGTPLSTKKSGVTAVNTKQSTPGSSGSDGGGIKF